ncbi:ATP synthase subunit mitochondrial [Brachionus plicatilis]|uniref:ATP synthase subunit d, mitochondrial n=1 Tax=Brachionus plicatilis TaxID=10195 RepID=A0A3M7TAE3_BRAPC|nr:ATP synthase subunit mitochondrial [Brachionus plicatilis]
MAARRVSKSSVDWAKLQKVLPQGQQSIYSNLLAKNYQYTSVIASLPDNLPKIDFESYRKQLANPSAIDKLEKGYLAFQAPYPKDTENAVSKIDQSEKEEVARLTEFLKQISQATETLKAEKFKLNNIPPLEEMTMELDAYYFPEKADIYKSILEEEDAYAKILEAKKKGHHH